MKPVRQLEINERNGWTQINPTSEEQVDGAAFKRTELDRSTLVVCFYKDSIWIAVESPGRKYGASTGLLMEDGRIWCSHEAYRSNLVQRVRPWRDAMLTMSALRCL